MPTCSRLSAACPPFFQHSDVRCGAVWGRFGADSVFGRGSGLCRTLACCGVVSCRVGGWDVAVCRSAFPCLVSEFGVVGAHGVLLSRSSRLLAAGPPLTAAASTLRGRQRPASVVLLDPLHAFRLAFDTTQVRGHVSICLLYTSPSPRDRTRSRMPSSA